MKILSTYSRQDSFKSVTITSKSYPVQIFSSTLKTAIMVKIITVNSTVDISKIFCLYFRNRIIYKPDSGYEGVVRNR
jgi:hypothetical protein